MNNSATTFENSYFKAKECNNAKIILLKLNMLDNIVAVYNAPLSPKVISLVVALFSPFIKIKVSEGLSGFSFNK